MTDLSSSLESRVVELCYGENRRQKKAQLVASTSPNDPLGLGNFRQTTGMAPSYINVTDIDRQLETATRIGAVWELNRGRVPLIAVAVKHGNACGAAVGDDPEKVVINMVMGDKEAISGGFVLVNFEVTSTLARLLRNHAGPRILDGVVAPSFAEGAVEVLDRKTGKCRIFVNEALGGAGLGMASIDATPRFRQVRGGKLEQDGDPFVLKVPAQWQSDIDPQQVEDLMLGWAVGSTQNSNTVVLTKGGMLIGPGVGQRSRVAASKLALEYAKTYGHDVAGAVAYSDSFFPFHDAPMVLADAGIRIIFATSGSIRDEEVMAVCVERGVKLLTLPDAEARGFYGH